MPKQKSHSASKKKIRRVKERQNQARTVQQKSQARQKDNQENAQSSQHGLRRQDQSQHCQEHAAVLIGG